MGGVEKISYDVIRKDGSFQIRYYPHYLVAETVVDSSMEDAGNRAFGRLFRYISGDNNSENKIAMTAPVTQEPVSEKIAMTAPVEQTRSGDSWKVAFAMPSKYTMDSLPIPNNDQVVLRRIEPHHSVSIKYRGNWSEERYLKHLEKLRAWMKDNDLKEMGEPTWSRYDPPFMPSFFRRNEILIPIEFPSANP